MALIDTETGEIFNSLENPDVVAEPAIDTAKLEKWWDIQAQLKILKDSEMSLRRELFGMAFPAPTEGTNKFALDGGWILNGGYKLSRTVDQAAILAMREVLESAGIPVDKLVEYKPDLRTAEYRKLSDEQRNLFDQVLTIKPGSPSLDIIMPKRGR